MKKTLSLLAVATFALFTLNSCSKDDGPGGGGSMKIQYKAIGSSGVIINTIVLTTDGVGEAKTITNHGKGSFESEVYTMPANNTAAGMSVTATGPSDNSTLKAQIWKDGKLWKESDANGTTLVTSVQAAN